MKDLQHDDFPDRASLSELPQDAVWIAQWREMGCRRALGHLLRANSGNVVAMARGWSRGMALQDDLVSEGMLALIGCLDGYVPRADVPFFAYARPFVRAAMRRAFYREGTILAVPMHHFRALREKSMSAYDEARLRAARNPERLDEVDGPELEADCDTAEARLIRAEAERRRRRALDAALSALSDTDRMFVERRCSSGAGSLSDLARRRGLSDAKALRMEARALARLRTQLILGGVTTADAERGS